MNLRIISGTLKGRRISLREGQVTFRATKDRVRQSLADMVNEKVIGAIAADVCAGSGAFGIELVSRGAAEVHFVEHDRVLAGKISDCTKALGISQHCRVFEQEVRNFIRKCSMTYDIIFYDPPYENEALAALVGGLVPLLSKDGWLFYEYSMQRNKKAQTPGVLEPDGVRVETKRYGETAVDIFRKLT
jgi:16S rRNA (guanine966-N2)-methyltransferase